MDRVDDLKSSHPIQLNFQLSRANSKDASQRFMLNKIISKVFNCASFACNSLHSVIRSVSTSISKELRLFCPALYCLINNSNHLNSASIICKETQNGNEYKACLKGTCKHYNHRNILASWNRMATKNKKLPKSANTNKQGISSGSGHCPL